MPLVRALALGASGAGASSGGGCVHPCGVGRGDALILVVRADGSGADPKSRDGARLAPAWAAYRSAVGGSGAFGCVPCFRYWGDLP